MTFCILAFFWLSDCTSPQGVQASNRSRLRPVCAVAGSGPAAAVPAEEAAAALAMAAAACTAACAATAAAAGVLPGMFGSARSCRGEGGAAAAGRDGAERAPSATFASTACAAGCSSFTAAATAAGSCCLSSSASCRIERTAACRRWAAAVASKTCRGSAYRAATSAPRCCCRFRCVVVLAEEPRFLRVPFESCRSWLVLVVSKCRQWRHRQPQHTCGRSDHLGTLRPPSSCSLSASATQTWRLESPGPPLKQPSALPAHRLRHVHCLIVVLRIAIIVLQAVAAFALILKG